MSFPAPYTPDFKQRDSHEKTDPLFVQRWSPRAFSPVKIAPEILQSLFDAARWSPSCFNEQPWRFYSAAHHSSSFAQYRDLLLEGNQSWASNASVLGFLFAQRHFAGNLEKDNGWAAFDSGAAWMALALQARIHGLHSHAMGGVKNADCYRYFDLPTERFKLCCAFAIGALATPDSLPQDMAQREQPSGRKPLSQCWYHRD